MRSGGRKRRRGSNHTMEVIASGRYILLLGSLDRYPVAMRHLIHSRDSFSLPPRVYVVACQSTSFARGIHIVLVRLKAS